MRLTTFAFLAGTLLLLSTPPAWAQSPQVLLKKGNALFAKAEYEEALEVFKKAYGQKQDAVFLRSMAFCELKLYRHEKAREYLQEYIKKFPKAPDIAKLKELEGNLEIVIQTKLEVSSTPPGATIYIDAEVAGKVGVTPKTLTIEPGKHLVILKMDSYHTTTQSFEIKPKETLKIAMAMEVPISVKSTPDGASVHFGSPTSESLGNTPLETGIAPGAQKVYIKKDGYMTHETALNVVPSQPPTVDAQLQLGVAVESKPPGATVLVDGQEKGTTPAEVPLPPGSHDVEVRLGQCQPFKQQVTIQPGQPNKVEAKLGCGLLSMRTDIEGAEVKVDSESLGTTPFKIDTLAPGSHKVTITHPDRSEWSGALDLDGRHDITARVKRGRKSWPVWTLAGVAVASLVLGIVGNVMAVNREAEEAKNPDGSLVKDDDGKVLKKFTDEGGNCAEWTGEGYEDRSCPSNYQFHHMTTVGYTLAGTAGVSSFLYYWFFVRPKVEISRTPAGQATAAQR